MTMLSIIQSAQQRLGLTVSTTVAGSTDDTAVQLLALLNQAGEELAEVYPWQALQNEATFTTVATEEQGSISDIAPGFFYLLNQTIWNRSLRRPVFGALNPEEWQLLKASSVTGPFQQFRLRGDKLRFIPAPPAGQTCAFEYITKNWVGSNAAATYAMDATLAAITALGYNSRLALSNGSQTGTYTIQSGLVSSYESAAGSLATLIDFSTGTKVVEFSYSAPSITGGTGTSVLQMDGSIFDVPLAVNPLIRSRVLVNDNGTYTAQVLLGATVVYSGTTAASGRFSFVLDAATSSVTAKLNGVALTLSSSTYTPQAAYIGMSIMEAYGVDAAHAGKTASMTLISSDLLDGYITGATDISGNPLVGGKSSFTLDTDTSLLDERLLSLSLIWRFKQAQGLDFSTELQMFENRLANEMTRDGGKPVLDMNGKSSVLMPGIMVPQGSWPL